MALQVMIAEDHEIVRLGLRSVLNRSGIEIKNEAKSGEEALELVSKNRYDVVVLDIRLPHGDGLYVLGRIKLEKPETPVVLFSGYDNPTYVARAVALGASGYVLKSDAGDRLIESIQTAALGGTTWTREELRRVSGALATPKLNTESEVPLTNRESEVLKHLSNGLTNKEIAIALDISYETVKEHVQHILRKIGVTDRTQAAVWAVRQNLV
jgi:DNA-binding NarL/FixJ family response regulator